jgi:hypothetical protein
MPERDGYCEHGVYVGGCGIDWMCGYCENGVTAAELAEAQAAEDVAEFRRAQLRIACLATQHTTSLAQAEAEWAAFRYA